MSSLVIWCHLIITSLKSFTFCSFHSTPLNIIRTVFIILCSIKSNLEELCHFSRCRVIIFHPIPLRLPLLVGPPGWNQQVHHLSRASLLLQGWRVEVERAETESPESPGKQFSAGRLPWHGAGVLCVTEHRGGVCHHLHCIRYSVPSLIHSRFTCTTARRAPSPTFVIGVSGQTGDRHTS